MLFLDLYTLPNSTTPDQILIDTIAEVDIVPKLLLAFVFFVVFIGGSMRQSLRTGTADFAMWSVVASLCTLMIALIMSTAIGFISLEWLVIVVVITILSGVWLYFDRAMT